MTPKPPPFTVFLDTEFTNLKSVSPGLISVGLVAEDGRECYVELSDNFEIHECSDFVVQNVLPLLEGGDVRMSASQAASKIKEWVESLGDAEVVLRTDAPRYDWVLIAELFHFYGCWPANLRRKYSTVFFETENQTNRYLMATANYWKDRSARQHHALDDARCMLFAWKFALGKEKL